MYTKKQKLISHPLSKIYTLSLAVFLSSTSLAGIGDGPRAYLPPPIDTNVFTLYGMKISGNSMFNSGLINPNLDLDIDLLVAQYTRTMSIADHYVSITAVQPSGKLSSTFSLPNVAKFTSKTDSDGLADTQLLLTGGIYNLPPLTLENYRKYKPSFAVGGLARLTLPTGEYDEQQSANLGSNRYSLQLGSPITFGFGESFLDPQLTTIDFLPSITFFGDNNEPFNANTIKQKPLFKLESHITHNFNPGLWLSIDGIYSYGGETKTDGQSNNNTQRSLNMAATLGLQFSKSFGLKLSYGQTIDRNDDGLDGEFTRLTLTYTQL